jgi:hypothetical protein
MKKRTPQYTWLKKIISYSLFVLAVCFFCMINLSACLTANQTANENAPSSGEPVSGAPETEAGVASEPAEGGGDIVGQPDMAATTPPDSAAASGPATAPAAAETPPSPAKPAETKPAETKPAETPAAATPVAPGGTAPAAENPAAETKPAEPEKILTKEDEERIEAENALAKEKEDAARILDLEIKTSTLLELAEWCRELQLSEGGGREELAQRIRNHFQIAAPAAAPVEEGAASEKIITIESARTTDYFTLESVNEEYAKLSGGVRLNLKDGTALHKIQAWEILFNRTRNILTATGNVEYVKEEGDTQETFRGDTITINLDTWSGSFIDTISERSLAGAETAYRFAGRVISKTDSETTVLTKAKVTNAKISGDTESYWSLDASKLWILPGSDWALFNGVLKVGEIPVLWVPFFFLPADEIVFHPVLGTRTREGSFLQSTTYIFGRADPSAMTENSISKILGSGEGMEKVRDGVFLRTTGKRAQTTDNRRVALLLDAYTNLGFYIGTEMSMPQSGPLAAWTLSGGLAITRTIFKPAESYFSPIDDTTQTDDWNKSLFFGIEVPFRFRLKTGFTISGKYGSVSLALPFYSDPFIDNDVMRRTESMDWMDMLRSGNANLTDQDVTNNMIGAYEWSLTGRPNISTTALAPIISSMAINSVSSVYHFSYKDNKEIINEKPYSPERTFFFPDKWSIFSISGSISGTPLSWTSATSVAEKDKAVEDPLKNFGVPIPPWNETTQAETSSVSGKTGGNGYALSPPALSQTFSLAHTNGLRLSWDYSLTPTFASELYYSTQDWLASEDADLSDIRSILMTMRTDGRTGLTLSEPNNGVFSISAGITGNAQWQDHVYRNDEAEEYATTDEVNREKLTDYRSTNWTTSWTHSSQINPLYWNPLWKTSNVQYSISGLLARSKFDETSTADNPEWEIVNGEWIKEDISAHRITTNFGVSVFDKMQNLSLYSDLPPLDTSLSINGTTRLWITETNANTLIKQPFEGEPEFQPANFTETLNFGTGRLLRQYITYDPKYEEITNMTTEFNFSGFVFKYNAARSPGYTLAYNANKTNITGWQARDSSQAELRPLSMNMSYSKNFDKKTFFNKRFSFSINTGASLNFDLQRYTYTKLAFNLSATVGINNFLDFTLGTTSENSQMFFYLSDLPFFKENGPEIKQYVTVYEDNFFKDLVNSFRFNDEEIRRKSGFKLKTFNLAATHHLGDWDAVLSVSMTPWRDPADPSSPYRFITNVSFSIQWLPISELKTQITYDGQRDVFSHQ